MLEELVGSRAKVRILRLLCAHSSREYTLRELSRAVGLSLGTTVPSVEGLLRSRIVTSRRAGRSRLVRLNERHPLAPALGALFREEARALARVAAAFADALPAAGLRSAILFGSAARGEPSARSDVDILVVVDDARRTDAIRREANVLLDRTDAAVSPLILTDREVERRLASFDPLLETIAGEGKLLRGRAPWLGR